MGQEQSTPQEQQPAPQNITSKVSQQGINNSQISGTSEEKIKRHKQNQGGVQPMFQGSFSVSQSKPLQDEEIDQDYDLLAEGQGQQQQQQQQLAYSPATNIQTQTFGQNSTQLGGQQQKKQGESTVPLNTSGGYSYHSNNKNTAYFGQNENILLSNQGFNNNHPNNIPQQQYQEYNQYQQPMNQQGYSYPNQYNPQYAGQYQQSSQSQNNLPVDYQYQQENQQQGLYLSQDNGVQQSGVPQEHSQYWDSLQEQHYDQRKIDIIEKVLYQSNESQVVGEKPKKLTPQESQMVVNRLLLRGKQIERTKEITNDYYEEKDLKECTFQPNVSLMKSVSPSRSLSDFLNEQNKFLANRELNIKRVAYY